MAELSNIKSVLSVKKKSQNTNKTLLKKVTAKTSRKPVEMSTQSTKVKNLQMKPKIQKTTSTKEIVKKPNGKIKMAAKASMLIMSSSTPTKQTLQSGQKAQQVKYVPIGMIPVHKKVETDKVDMKNKIVIRKTVKAKTVPSKSALTSTVKPISMREGPKQMNTSDVKQTDANNKKQSVFAYT